MRLPPRLPPIGRSIDRGPAAELGKPPVHTKTRAPASSDPHAAGAQRQTPYWRGLLGWPTSAQKHPQTLLILLQMTWQPRTFPSNLLSFCPSLKVRLLCHSLMALPACLVCSLFFSLAGIFPKNPCTVNPVLVSAPWRTRPAFGSDDFEEQYRLSFF